MVIGHISPHQQKGGLSVPQHTGLYQAQTLELRGRKRREADHAHFIVTLRFYDSQEAVNYKPALFRKALCLRSC